MGDDAFGRLLTTWTSRYRNGNGTTAEMRSLAAQAAGRNLDPLFQAWLYGTTKPPHP
jgi:aminopeptidase N